MKRLAYFLVFFLPFAASLIMLWACRDTNKFNVVKPIATPLWRAIGQSGIQIKLAADGTGDLLLFNPNEIPIRGLFAGGIPVEVQIAKAWPIYRYNVATQGLEQISRQSWDDVSGSVALCNDQNTGYEPEFRWGETAGWTLQLGGNLRPTAGHIVLAAAKSLDNERVCSLSATGSVSRGGLFPLPFSDPHISGKRIHQVFKVSNGAEIGQPLMLETTTDRNNIYPCWAPDHRHVVYQDSRHEHLWIIEVP